MKKKIFNKAFFAGLAKKHGLYSTMFRNLGHGHDTEIIVEDEYFDRLVHIQNKLECFCAMGDDERRAFYLIVPRPSPEEWGNCDDDIASGEYENREEWLVHFISGRFMETGDRSVAMSTAGS